MELDAIVCMDALEFLRGLPDESVHCVVTSPPYFGLRDYSAPGQLGLEPTPAEYVAALVVVFREVRRVLCKDGVVFLNLGDSYAGSGARSSNPGGKTQKQMTNTGSYAGREGQDITPSGFKPKDRMMIPARVAIALQDDGWWIRDEIIWHKPNPMPYSGKDRTTPAHEMVYMLTRSAHYWYDAAAIAEPCVYPDDDRKGRASADHKRMPTERMAGIRPRADKQAATGKRQYTGFNDRWDASPTTTRNKRSVWTVSPQPFAAAHFATFAPDLIRPMILAGCPVGGVVLDPFMGAGTVALVAQQLGRHYLGCDLNADYVEMATMRVAGRLDEYLARERGEDFTAYMFATPESAVP